jgi:hypothetical protein
MLTNSPGFTVAPTSWCAPPGQRTGHGFARGDRKEAAGRIRGIERQARFRTCRGHIDGMRSAIDETHERRILRGTARVQRDIGGHGRFNGERRGKLRGQREAGQRKAANDGTQRLGKDVFHCFSQTLDVTKRRLTCAARPAA